MSIERDWVFLKLIKADIITPASGAFNIEFRGRANAAVSEGWYFNVTNVGSQLFNHLGSGGSVTFLPEWGRTYHVKVSFVGQTIRISIDGTVLATVTSSVGQTNTYWGIGMFRSMLANSTCMLANLKITAP